MTPHTTQPSFGQTPQDQRAPQAAPDARPGHTTTALAERHEALWLSLTALHKDIAALAAKKPGAPVSEPVRITTEGLLSDCVPFLRKRGNRLPVAAADLLGLSVQLGQALAAIERYELAHSGWDAEQHCFAWRVDGGSVPVRRLRPQVAGAAPGASREMEQLQEKLARRINAITKGLPDEDDEDDGPPRARAYAPRPPAPYPPGPRIR